MQAQLLLYLQSDPNPVYAMKNNMAKSSQPNKTNLLNKPAANDEQYTFSKKVHLPQTAISASQKILTNSHSSALEQRNQDKHSAHKFVCSSICTPKG
jgi:hypothetical protein